MSEGKKNIVIQDLINHVKNGVTRCIGDPKYDEKLGSIEELYGLSQKEVKELFKHPYLKGLRISSKKQINY